jgi:hypothetical protein
MLEWIGLSSAAAWWIVVVSVAIFFFALIALPPLVVRIPADYFAHPHRFGANWPRRLAWLRWPWLIVKNLLGLGCLFFGVLMLVLPGQGVLTLLIGTTLLDFPGKYKLQRWVVSRRGVLQTINWLRERADKEPLVLER